MINDTNKILHHATPEVSIIMPAYNAALTLKQAVNSILAQTYHNFELIICNDASTDETQSVLRKVEDNRVRVIQNDVNLGPGLSRDRAIEISIGNWLAFTDADDTWNPDRLKTLLKVADLSKNMMIFDDIIECHDTSMGLKPYHVLRGQNAFGGNGRDTVQVSLKDFIVSKRLVMHPILPRNFVKLHSIKHTTRRFGEDTEFFLKLLALGLKLYYIPKPMYMYRITPGSMTGSPDRYRLMREVLENSINLFDHTPVVQSALRKKIAIVTRDEKYLPFICALKKCEFIRALRLVYQSPWIITEFFRRLSPSLFYHIHRVWYGGKLRVI